MNLTKLSIKFGFQEDYLGCLKRRNTEKYKAIVSNPKVYIAKVESMVNKMMEIHQELIEKESLYKFSKILVKHKIIKHRQSIYSFFDKFYRARTSDREIISIPWNQVKKMEQVIRLYKGATDD
ncbi:hypothetical protein [Nitrosophilus kaiyonis]|uniref:hypothetical protein n=1 Tax=Nitrosophilus kaiyonis TaxID=2930200 RepID=UPI00249364AA|nr:hypothetical protein [Nitrosophilus kaiyonis]